MVKRLSPSTFFLKQELEARGYQVQTFDSSILLEVRKKDVHFFTNASKSPVQNSTSYLICRDKYLAREVLRNMNVPIPRYTKLRKGELLDSEIHFPVVMKPLSLEGGKDVEVNISSHEEVALYFTNHSGYEEVLVEEQLEGEDTRILIVMGKFYAAVKRIPAFVTGDGIHSIAELVQAENDRRREIKKSDEARNTYSTDLELIVFDSHAHATLAESGFSERVIPIKNSRVFVRKNANTSTGGISVDVTNQVCQEIRRECERIAEGLCMSTVGVDIMTDDLGKPLDMTKKSGVVEVNASPGLDLHILTDEGVRRNPVPLIVDEIEESLRISVR